MLAGQALSPDHELALYIRDALRLISAFIIPISQCSPQIYVSALSFAPTQSLVATKFRLGFPNIVAVTEGQPDQWPMVIFTAEHHKDDVYCIFSPNQRTFASISAYNGIIMCVCDSETGHCISGPFMLPYNRYIRGACFSPDGKHILLKFSTYAVVLDIVIGEEQFQIEGKDFVFIHHDGRIVSAHWINEDENFIRRIDWGDSKDDGGAQTGIVVKSWDASNDALICNKLFEVDDVARTQFSPDGHFLAIAKKSESVIELWNLEAGKDPQRLWYPPGDSLKLLRFSPTSDSLMAVSRGRDIIYLWRLDTQEMASFSHHFPYDTCVIHSPLTNYLFIKRDHTVEIWDVSVNGSKLIWETNPPTTSLISSICPSRDGHRLLVGCKDGSVRLWELDLENLAMNQADTIDPQADADMPEFTAFSHSGNMVATRSGQSHIELLDTTTGEVVLRTDIDKQDYDDMEIAFSPDEDQVAFLSRSLITVCDIMHPNNRLSFNPWPRKDIRIRKVAFQTRNGLVICASDDDSALLQVWHPADPAGFKCMYSLDIRVKKDSRPFLAPDGLTVVIILRFLSAKFYSWNHDTAQFHPVDFDDQVHISLFPLECLPVYSPDGRLFACWSRGDSYVRVWDTRTGQLVSKFSASRMDAMALSPTLIEHSPSDRLIALLFEDKDTIHLLDVYTSHLYAKILGRGSLHMVFIRDGTKLAQYSRNFGLRIWDIADLMNEHWHSTHGYKPILQGIRDGWVVGRDNEPLFWVPVEHRKSLCVPSPRVVLRMPRKKATKVDLSKSRLCRKWAECIDKEWLRELERKKKELGNLLEKYVLSSAQVL